ncbi:MAG: hypothetical protein QOE31_442 [Solirubrobacteraceae bacterium]|jgi:hypothetical protein|nr:hypothetical protein [Solirubrobacteraceae bacterium]
MKRPSLKRRKEPTPQELAAAAPVAVAPEKKRRLRGAKKKALTPQEQARAGAAPPAPKKKKPKKTKELTPQEQAAVSAAPPAQKKSKLGAPARLAGKPFKKVGGLKGKVRIVVWGLLAIVVVFGALQLRGGRDDDKLVRQSLERYEQASSRKDYQALCDDLLARSYVKQTASSGLPCEVALRTALEDVRNPTLDVLSVEVNGDRAAARVRGSAAGQVPGEAVYTLVREDDSWRILPPRPSSAAAAP